MELLSIEALNQYKSLILVGLSFIYAITTMVLWYFTNRSTKLAQKALEEMKKTHEEEMRPYLSIHPEINSQGWFVLTLTNYGRTAAFNAKLSFTKGYIARKEREETLLLSDLGICEPLPFVGPHSTLTEIINFKSYNFWEMNEGQRTLKGVLTYADTNGTLFREEIVYDLNPLFKRKNLIYPSMKTTVEDLEQTCKKLNRNLDQLSFLR